MPTNTYAINTTRNKEFEVEAEMKEMGLKPWVPRALCSRKIKERKDLIWYDRAYVPKLMFCVIPAIYYRDALDIKHIHGKPLHLSQLDIDGMPQRNIPRRDGSKLKVAAIPGLIAFKSAVQAEYAATERLRDLGEWECVYKPGQALEIISGAMGGFTGTFQKTVKDARRDHPMLQLNVEMFGRQTAIEVAPDAVSC